MNLPALRLQTLRSAICPILGGFALGVGYGNIGGIIDSPAFLKATGHPSDSIQQLLAAATQIGCIVGSVLAFKATDSLGRLRSSVIFGALLLAGCILASTPLAISTLCPGYLMAVIFAGRFVSGVGNGGLCVAVPVYASECAAADVRGAIEASFQLFVVLGILAAYIVNFFEIPASRWRICLAWQVMPSLVFLIVMATMLPESPRWLALAGRPGEAAAALTRFRAASDEAVKSEVEAMQQPAEASDPSNARSSLLSLRAVVAVMVCVLQVATGIDVIVVYAPSVFGKSGSEGDLKASLLDTMYVGLAFVAFTSIAVLLVDRLGRRFLLLCGSATMTVALVALAVISSLHPGDEADSRTNAARVVLVVAYVGAFSLSWGPVAWVLPSELIDSRARARVLSIGTVLNWTADYAVISTWLSLSGAVGEGGAFALYAVVNLFALIFVFVVVPETAGLRLEDISNGAVLQDERDPDRRIAPSSTTAKLLDETITWNA